MVVNAYYQLIKPRMVMMNVLVAVAVFIFASPGEIDWAGLNVMASGLAFVVASACVFNNYADREIDARMERTKNRGVAAGMIKPMHALIFGSILLAIGVGVLSASEPLALGAALFGFGMYVFVYTPLKPRSAYALYPGAVAGAVPTLVGYAAATGTLDLIAGLLFALLFLWQIPHFLAIARYRFEEYSAASVPLLVEPPKSEAARRQARKIFHLSLLVLVLVCLLLILHKWMR